MADVTTSKLKNFFPTPPAGDQAPHPKPEESPLACRSYEGSDNREELTITPGQRCVPCKQQLYAYGELIWEIAPDTHNMQTSKFSPVATPTTWANIDRQANFSLTPSSSQATWATIVSNLSEKTATIPTPGSSVPAWRTNAPRAPGQMAPSPTQAANASRPPGTSRTWQSIEPEIQRKWFQLEPHLSRLYPEGKGAHSVCPYIPRQIREFRTHVKEFRKMEDEQTTRKREHKDAIDAMRNDRKNKVIGNAIGVNEVPLPPVREGLDGMADRWGSVEEDPTPEDRKLHPDYHSNPANRSAVLGQQTIWCRQFNVAFRETAPWPTMQEMKWEGPQRVATESGKYGRFLALPRVPASVEIGWQTLPLTKFYPLDEVWRIPTEEDVYAPTEEIPDELVPKLLGEDMLEAMNPVDVL